MARISIIIANYNNLAWIGQALQSVVNQVGVSLADIEVIIVDDASTDGSHFRAVDMVAQIGPGMFAAALVYQMEKNSGVVAVRNKGLSVATGKYLVFLDSDDRLHPDFCATMAKRLDDNPSAPAAACWVSEISEDSEEPRFDEVMQASTFNAHRGPWTHREVAENCALIPSQMMIRANALRWVGDWQEVPGAERCEDWLLAAKLTLLGPILCVEDPLTRYRRHPAQFTQNWQRPAEQSFERVRDEILRRRGRWIAGEWAPGWITDPLGRVRAYTGGLPADKHAWIATVASSGWESQISMMLSSLRRVGMQEWSEKERASVGVAVFRLGDAPGVDEVAAAHGAVVVECEPIARLAAWSKSILYRAAEVLAAEVVLAIDADCLVRAPLPLPPFDGGVQPFAAPALAAVVDGNGVRPSGTCAYQMITYAKALELPQGLVDVLGLDGAAGLRGPAFNDGVMVANRQGLAAANAWMEDEIARIWWVLDHFDQNGMSAWWNQVIFNVSVHRQRRLYQWLPWCWNAQMHAVGDFVERRTGGRMVYGGKEVLIQHFTGHTKHLQAAG